MQRQRKGAGTPNRQVQSARAGRQAKPIVHHPEEYVNVQHYQQRRYEEQLKRNFKCGFYLGLLIGLVLLALVVWLWAIPTVDGCVASLNAMQGVSA